MPHDQHVSKQCLVNTHRRVHRSLGTNHEQRISFRNHLGAVQAPAFVFVFSRKKVMPHHRDYRSFTVVFFKREAVPLRIPTLHTQPPCKIVPVRSLIAELLSDLQKSLATHRRSSAVPPDRQDFDLETHHSMAHAESHQQTRFKPVTLFKTVKRTEN